MVNFIKDSASQTQKSSRLAQNVFSLGNYLLVYKRLIISKFCTHTSKVGVVVLVVKPWGHIRGSVSVFINMLGIRIDSYGHVLSPPRFFFNSEKVKFFHKIRPFFNGLIEKLQNVIKDGPEVRFWCGDTRFHTQSIFFTPEATFHMFRAAKTSR